MGVAGGMGAGGGVPLGHKKIKQARGVLIYGQQICSANVQLRPRPKNSTRGTKRQGQVLWPGASGRGSGWCVGGRSDQGVCWGWLTGGGMAPR